MMKGSRSLQLRFGLYATACVLELALAFTTPKPALRVIASLAALLFGYQAIRYWGLGRKG